MIFSNLCQYFEKISQTTSRLKITELLADLFKKLSSEEIGNTVYLLQGRLGPLYEKLDFGIAEKLIIKSCVLALNIDQKLFEKKYKQIGDLGETVFLLKKEIVSFEKKDFGINEIFNQLLRLAKASGQGSQDFKTGLLADLIRRSDPLSGKYLVRIPLGILRLGFSDMTVLDGLSWMISGDKSLRSKIEKGYHVRPDLGFIAKTVKDKGVDALAKLEPKIFTPIIMMRAERLSSAEEILKKIGESAVEPKYDGFRLQIHYRKGGFENQLDEIRLFSRGLEDVTYMYPDIVEGVKKEIKSDAIIFEGEAIGYNPKEKKFLPFQETVQRKRKFNINKMSKEIPLKLFVYELLYLDGKSYLNIPFRKRREVMERLINKDKDIEKNSIFLTPTEICNNAEKINNLFDQAVNNNLEGIIAKKLDGIYQAGARGWNWIKFKQSYSSRLNDTIDGLVMGYDLGKGKRTSFGIGAFLVGIYDQKNDRFLTVAKIGTGLTDEEWKSLKVKSQRLKVKSKPENYIVDKQMKCDVWVAPSIVVEIRADEITHSPVHTAGYALRFPRLERFRDDKNLQEVTTLEELKKNF